MSPDKYDVAIIGAGMGGLCSAALLTHYGYRTLVVERLPFVGGRCSSFKYKGFTLPTGALYVETGGVVEELFKEVGADFPVRAFPMQLCFRMSGKDYPMPLKGGLKTLLANFVSEQETARLLNLIRRAFGWFEPSCRLSIREWLMQHTQNEQVLNVFRGLVNYQCVNFSDQPAGEFIRQLKFGTGATAGATPEGFLHFMQQLVKVVEKGGGQVWTDCRAKKITILDGVATGVVIEKGGKEEEIRSSVVISDTGPHRTVELAGKQNFEKGYLLEVKEKVRPLAYMEMAISSNDPLLEFPGVMVVPEGRRQMTMMATSLAYPEYAPPGKHLLQAWATPESSFLPMDPKKEMDLMLQDLREAIPGFDHKAEVLHASYWQKEWPMYRALPGMLTQKTPVENLYNVGDGVAPLVPLGLPGCAHTARIVAGDIKQRIRPQAG